MTFVSYAQNFEDVLLWRALKHVGQGFYIDVGAAHPDTDSVTRAFYDRGWSGINIEPVEEYALRLKASRSRDVTLQMAVGEKRGTLPFFVVQGTGLSTLESDLVSGYGDDGFLVQRTVVDVETLAEICRRHAPADIHFLKVDVEGAERSVLAGADFKAFRPWIVLVESTAPMSTTETHEGWESLLLSAGYRYVYFDGLNRFYVSEERHDDIAPHFRLPPNVFDDFMRAADTEWARRINQAETRVADLQNQLRIAEELGEQTKARTEVLLDQLAKAEHRAETAEHRAEAAEERLHSLERQSQDARDRVEAASTRLAEELRASTETRVRLAASGQEIASLRDALAHADRKLAETEARTAVAEHEARAGAEWLAAIRNSTSWRVTRPVRYVLRALGRGRAAPPDPPAATQAAEPEAPDSPGEPVAQPLVLPPLPIRRGAARRAVHQFHSGSAYGDAVTNSMLLTRRVLRDFGYVSEIFVEHRDPALADELRPIADLPQHDDYVLIVRHSMGFDAFQRIVDLPAPKILLYHNITPPEFLSHAPVLQDYARLGRKQLAALRPHVTAALADSEYNALELRKLGFDPVRPCTLLFDIDALLANALPRPDTEPHDVFTVLFVGRVIESKAQNDLVAAFARFHAEFEKPSRLVLVGRHDGAGSGYYDSITARIREHGLGEHVTLTGLVSDEELHDWYRAADLYVSLSHHEGFGVPLIEAMAHRIPVLAWPSGAVPYTMGDGAELLHDRSPDAVAARMLELARNCGRRARIVERQQHSLARFSLQQQTPRLLDALALAGAAPPADLETRHTLAANMQFTVVGHVNKTYSLSAINRFLARMIEEKMPGRVRVIPVEGGPTDDLSEVPAEYKQLIATLAGRPKPITGPEVVISQHYPLYVPEHRGDLLYSLFAWEESVVPGETIAELNRAFDAVLAPSEFVAKSLLDSGLSIPVYAKGQVPQLDGFRKLAAERRESRRGNRPCTFLHVSSCFPRKGVDVLLAAYARAFRAGDNVRLVIKGFPNPHNDVEEQIARLRADHANLAEIVFLNRDMNEQEVLDLYRDADAVVLPTRGEGFNMPAAEAMTAGIPVLVTGFGGHMDFCDSDTARLIEFRFARSGSHLASPHSVWVEPDPKDLASAMREIAGAHDSDGPERAFVTERTARAQATIARHLDSHAFVRRLTDTSLTLLLSPLTPTRMAWVSTWDVRCGIAEYSRYLLDNRPQTGFADSVTILCEERTPQSDTRRLRVRPAWRIGDAESIQTLAEAIAAEDPHVLVVQHQPGLLSWECLARLLSAPELAQRVVAVTLHNTRHIMDIEESERTVVVGAMSRIARIVVHTIADLNLLKSLGLVANVVMFPQGAPPPRPAQTPRLLPRSSAPLIGCYGFFLPGKGIPQLVKALSILRKHWPNARLRLVNADYGAPASTAEIALCRHMAQELGIADAIEWKTDFLPDDQCQALLAECDVVALPYQASKEAASAALRMALSASVPVAVTPLPLFDEAGDAVMRLADTDPQSIADGLGKILKDRDLRIRTSQAAQEWLMDRSWNRIAERLHGMMLGLALRAASDRAVRTIDGEPSAEADTEKWDAREPLHAGEQAA